MIETNFWGGTQFVVFTFPFLKCFGVTLVPVQVVSYIISVYLDDVDVLIKRPCVKYFSMFPVARALFGFSLSLSGCQVFQQITRLPCE